MPPHYLQYLLPRAVSGPSSGTSPPPPDLQDSLTVYHSADVVKAFKNGNNQPSLRMMLVDYREPSRSMHDMPVGPGELVVPLFHSMAHKLNLIAGWSVKAQALLDSICHPSKISSPKLEEKSLLCLPSDMPVVLPRKTLVRCFFLLSAAASTLFS